MLSDQRGILRILHVITGLATGGAERALYNILAGGLRDNFNCHVLSLSDEGVYGERIRGLGVPVHALGMRRGIPSPGSVRQLRRLVRDVRPDLIQGWMYHGNLAASVAAWLASDRTALAWNMRHCLYDISLEKPMTRQVIRANRLLSKRPDAIVYNSNWSLEQHSDFGISRHRSQVIPNGFDLDVFRPDADTRRAQHDALGILPDARIVGYVGRFHLAKDQANLFHAAAGIAARHPDVRFLIAGRRVDTSNPALAGIIPAEMENRFIFLGERSDVQVLMKAMDVLCLSSAWGEAFPNVLGEAMASGVPCVATDVGDSRLIVGDTGVIVPPRDHYALADGLMSILSRPIEQRRDLGDAARERIKEKYSLSQIVNMYEALYERLVKTCE